MNKLTEKDQRGDAKARSIESQRRRAAQPIPAGRLELLKAAYDKAAANATTAIREGLPESNPKAYADLREQKRKAADDLHQVERLINEGHPVAESPKAAKA